MKALKVATVLLGSMPWVAGHAGAQQPNPIPPRFKAVYPSPSQADKDVSRALMLASQQHKRLILDFGTDRCADCQVLSGFWGSDTNQAQVAQRFLLVHVNVGPKGNQNSALAQRFNVNPKDGLPQVVVADSDGKVLDVSKEFVRAHNESAEDLTNFLNKARN